VERNLISSLESHGKALEKECCLPGVFCDTTANLIIIIIIIIILTPVLSSQGMKKLCYAIQKKYKNQAGMNLTPPPPPSQNSHAVRWHCTAESERRVAEIKS